MSLVEFRLDRAGIAEVLKSEPMRALVDEAAGKVADGARAAAPGADVDVQPYTSDRQGATVMVTRPGSADPEEVLTRAARAAGLEVTEQ
jgi:hypothetical protein